MRPLIGLKKIIFFWFPTIVWMGLIFFLSSFQKLQVSTVNWQDFITRKLAHFLEYVILCFLFYRGINGTTKLLLKERLFLAFILTVAYALTDEYHQTFVSGRTGKTFDIAVDSLGAGFGLIFCRKIIFLLPKNVREFFLPDRSFVPIPDRQGEGKRV